jgi:endonuclease YncB( thermonuclease family)
MFCPLFEAIDGHVVVTGYAPDGDSIRFLPRDPDRLGSLRRSSLLRRSPVNGSVQLRLEGIDAPELYYGTTSQPRGASARDALLSWLGVRDLACAADRTTVTSASPIAVPATILADAIDPHGRAIAWLLRERQQSGARRHRLTTAVVKSSANYALALDGHAYPLAYTSLLPSHRATMRDAGRRARDSRLGVWRDDVTRKGFVLRGERSIGPRGVLVFPKLFRRCVDYLAHRAAEGFRGTFLEWLASHGSRGAPVPDRIVLPHAANIPLATVVRERHGTISLGLDVLDLVFVE